MLLTKKLMHYHDCSTDSNEETGGDLMIEKVVRKADLASFSEPKENLAYWLSRSPSERVEAVEELRRQRHGDSARLQRVARVTDLTDLEALGEETERRE
jgi:hypothetical protein